MKWLLLLLLLPMVLADSASTTVVIGGSQEMVIEESYAFEHKPLVISSVTVVSGARPVGKALTGLLTVGSNLLVSKPFFDTVVRATIYLDFESRQPLSQDAMLEYWVVDPNGKEYPRHTLTLQEEDQEVTLEYALPLFFEDGEWEFFAVVNSLGIEPLRASDTFEIKDFKSTFILLGIALVVLSSYLLWVWYNKREEEEEE